MLEETASVTITCDGAGSAGVVVETQVHWKEAVPDTVMEAPLPPLPLTPFGGWKVLLDLDPVQA